MNFELLCNLIFFAPDFKKSQTLSTTTRNVIQDRLETLQGKKKMGAKEKAPPSPPQRRVKEKRKADRMGWHQEIENRSGLSSKKRERSQKRKNV